MLLSPISITFKLSPARKLWYNGDVNNTKPAIDIGKVLTTTNWLDRGQLLIVSKVDQLRSLTMPY